MAHYKSFLKNCKHSQNTFPEAVPPATPIRNGFFLSLLMRPPIDDDGEIELLLDLLSILWRKTNGR